MTDPLEGKLIDVIEQACKDAVRLSSQDQAAYLLQTIGARVTTAAVGLKDARAVRGWASGTAIKQPDVAQRLQELFQVVRALDAAYSPAVATAFLRGTNPRLGDRSPLAVLATDDPDEAGPALLAAARFIIEE